MSPHFDTPLEADTPSNTASEAQNDAVNGVNGATDHARASSAAYDGVSLDRQDGSTNDTTNGGTNGSTNGLMNGITNGINGGHSTNGHTEANGLTNGHAKKSPYLQATEPGTVYDLVCVGFGPASLAVAIALHDALEAGTLTSAPRVLFLEKQAQFSWHAGMLLPGAKMQISFIKDLASLRNPRSHFTFLNYLFKNNRLVEFTNLGTFLPARVEYEDYLRWCAGHFNEVVQYHNDVLSIAPVREATPLRVFEVASRNVKTGTTSTYRAHNVLMAIGGQPSLPKILPAQNQRIVHSSQYAHLVPKILNQRDAPYRVAVLGAGQSAAEIFNNIQTLYPNSRTYLVMRSEFLKPSDDSPL